MHGPRFVSSVLPQIQFLILGLLLSNLILSGSAYGSDMPPGILVNYSFDDQNVETGPDTFAVYKKSKGTVGLSTSFPYSGYHSVEIKDVAGDRDFPELQGYFPLQETGTVFAHFAFLVTDPVEPLNIALAGPRCFQVKKDGIGFWLSTKNGYLYHHSDSMPKMLFQLMPFTWYVVDLNYRIDEGYYDLTIRQEQQETPLVELKQQANVSSSASSTVDKFSFIGDLGDESNVVYYIDDVVIGTDKDVISQKIYKAPGRHKLFFDYLQEYQKQIHSHASCLPVDQMADIGLNDSNEYLLHPENATTAFLNLIAGNDASLKPFENQHPQTFSFLSAVKHWRQGCVELAAGKPKKAEDRFRTAMEQFDAPMYRLSHALALAESGKHIEANILLGSEYSYWADDPRYAIAQAMIAFNRKDWKNAERTLSPYAFSLIHEMNDATLNALWAGKLNGDLMEDFRKKMPDMWQKAISEFIMAEQYFYLLIWTGRHNEALEYAKEMTRYLERNELQSTLWHTRIGDSYFVSGDYTYALQKYQQALEKSVYKASLYKKISDIAFIQGDAQMERRYREMVYGSLSPE